MACTVGYVAILAVEAMVFLGPILLLARVLAKALHMARRVVVSLSEVWS